MNRDADMSISDPGDGDGVTSGGPVPVYEPVSDPPGESVTESNEENNVIDIELVELTDEELIPALEAILFVVESPVTPVALGSALRAPVSRIDSGLRTLTERLSERGSGLELRAVAGGYRLYTRASVHAAVEGFLLDGQRNKLSQAALESLAVIAYRQPISRARISAIRGVNVDGVVRTLLARGLVVEGEPDPETGAGTLRTTQIFLERLGLESNAELPSLAPLLPELDSLDIE